MLLKTPVKIIRENAFEKKEKEARVEFNPGLSANRPSNNWAQINGWRHGKLVFFLLFNIQSAVLKMFVRFFRIKASESLQKCLAGAIYKE